MLKQPRKRLLLFYFSCLIPFLVSCSAPQNIGPISATPSNEPQIAQAQATAAIPPTPTLIAVQDSLTTEPLPTPTDDVELIATEVAPTEAASEEPVAEPTSDSQTFTSATPLPPGWMGPGTFSDDVNPLTGERVEDPSVLQRRPIAIKISNYPAVVRPQAGLNNADLVFEHYAEGGVTRFTAVYYGQDAHTVGSVRSARIIDFEIPQMYDAAFGFSGAAGPNKERFGEVDWFDRIISPDFGHSGFYRAQPDDPDVDFWHTMFTDTYRLRDILKERGEDVAPQFQNGMTFSEQPPSGGSPVEQIEIGYRGSYVTWWYDTGVGRYYRWNDGERHNDANRGEQVNFKNVVVISAEHVDTWIPETEVGQGAKSIEIQIWGEGAASIFRDGQRFDGSWIRQDPSDMLTFRDQEGNVIPLAPGNTWFQLVPTGFDKLYVTS